LAAVVSWHPLIQAMQSQNSLQENLSSSASAVGTLDDPTLLSPLSSHLGDAVTPISHGPAMMPVQACVLSDGTETPLGAPADSIAEQGLSAVVNLYQNGCASAQNLMDRVAEVSAGSTTVQAGAGFADSASAIAGHTLGFTRDKAQDVVASVQGLVKTASENWNAPDNQAHNVLKTQAGKFVDGLGRLAVVVDESDRTDKVREYLGSATEYFTNVTDGVYGKLGYLDSPASDPRESELIAAELRLKENLINLRGSSDFVQTLEIAFGGQWKPAQAETWIDDFVTGKAAPTFEIVAADSLQSAAAYGNNTIFVSDAYLASSANDPKALDAVLLEEAGHYLDEQLNAADSPGDEGDIFARLTQGKVLSVAELAALRSENDHAKLLYNNQEIDIENFGFGSALGNLGNAASNAFKSATTAVSLPWAAWPTKPLAH
jgi:hypothetical protein